MVMSVTTRRKSVSCPDLSPIGKCEAELSVVGSSTGGPTGGDVWSDCEAWQGQG